MSIRLAPRRAPQSNDAAKLRKWANFFMTAGVIGTAIIQNRLLSVGSITSDELYLAMQNDPIVMVLATVALMCQALETCAVPLFAFLLVEGFQRTSSFEKYLVLVGAVALVSELPYNLAMTGKLFDLQSRNPAFSLVIGLVMLYFFRRFEEKGFKNTLVKVLIFLASFLWCLMLRIDHGIFVVIMTGVLWFVRKKDTMRSMYGFCAAMVCTLFNMFYIAACLGVILLHRYDEERGEQNPKFNYAYYPALLLVCGVVGLFLA